MSPTLTYCNPNTTLGQVWINHGVNPCFFSTLTSSISLGFVLIFGIGQILFYRKYASPTQHYILPYSQLFGLQMVLNGVMPFIALFRFLTELFILEPPGVLYGYQILSLIQSFLVWPLACILILRERHYMLPTIFTKGHGLVLLIFWTFYFVMQNMQFLNVKDPDWFFNFKTSNDIIRFAYFLTEYLTAAGIFLLGLKAPGQPTIRHSDSFTRLHPHGSDDDEDDYLDSSASQGSPWRKFWKKMRILAPFLWPSKSVKLQLYLLICFSTLIFGRIANVYAPIYSKKIVDSMTIVNQSSSLNSYESSLNIGYQGFRFNFRWDYILIFVGFKLLQGAGPGGSGVLNIFRSLLWVSVEQYTTREVQVSFFSHLHKLSLRWHLQRKTGEVLRAMDRGTDSINNILNYLIFNVVPTIADIIIAVVYFTTYFNGWFGLIVFSTMLFYLVATIWITEWRTKYRRFMNEADNLQRQQAVDSLLNFETVKYYANEDFETNRYQNTILNYQREEWKMNASLNVLNLTQSIIINLGLLVGSMLCVEMVVNKEEFTVGDYVLFSTYLMQLYGPLNFFGTIYRMLQQSFINMENMLDLFKEKVEVKDFLGAPDMEIKGGGISFRDVYFNYVPEKEILKGVSFDVPPGKTMALVGPSGSGKSTIIRLLFRFYDPSDGQIIIDGQDIKEVTQKSLRESIGVVPQDTVLFNDTIKYNILYGKIGSREHDMINAANCACIHDKIVGFPEGYESMVGERGLKLSGGEKQRVAIARTILKNPSVILLDEATSALDTQTERQIQNSLQDLCKNRTSIIVAHRLSTIVNADQILVLKDGNIVERGSHIELMSTNGLYAAMWNEQLKTENNTSQQQQQPASETETENKNKKEE